ncbi:hypothetical protein [Bradymonas sediminis]|uniref:hypothetical protein n=1 Tax=Bradymonas sediminis TaxID=1548548 RepID=UPI00105FCB83|nr:hypothetical protein [Bradymonas sediminis]TDP73461.1 hypothetical protein DFR33_106101 [Bradymonas sediminis]
MRFNTRIIAGCLLIACAGWPLSGCGLSTLSDDPDTLYASALRASINEEHTESARAAFHYMKSTNPDNLRYDRAEKLLAQNVEALGLHYAASLFYLDIAESRRDIRLVGDAVGALERILSRDGYDQVTLRDGFLARAEITGLPPNERAFIAYHQGLDSLRNNLMTWAEQRFAEIPETSPYRHRAEYALIIKSLASYELTEVSERLGALAEAKDLPEDLRTEIHRTLGRIAFEQKRYEEALEAYELIRHTATDDPSLLLEMAWSNYYRGNYQRALGLLVALDAPAYSGLIAPERYLLEALSLEQLCQFEPARIAATRLRARHGEAIDDLHAGTPLRQSTPIRLAARHREAGRAPAEFRRHMRHEAAKFAQMRDQFGPQLARHLDQIYAHGLKEAERREDEQLFGQMREVSEELLTAEEGVRLVLHELAVSVLRGRERNQADPLYRNIEVPVGGDTVFYKFDGEFWTDEIDNLVVPLEDRCVE